MTEISSYKIQLDQTLCTHGIVEIHRFTFKNVGIKREYEELEYLLNNQIVSSELRASHRVKDDFAVAI